MRKVVVAVYTNTYGDEMLKVKTQLNSNSSLRRLNSNFNFGLIRFVKPIARDVKSLSGASFQSYLSKR